MSNKFLKLLMTPEYQHTDSSINPEQLEAQRALSEKFLDSLIEKVRNEEVTTAEDVAELHQEFCEENPGFGENFALIHAWQVASTRDKLYEDIAENNPQKLPEDAPYLVETLDLLEESIYRTQT
jgi:hypothetical protein